jgi:hypothetical protein
MNTRKLLLSAVCTLAATSAFADAGVIKESVADLSPIQASNSQISFQAISTKVDYTETLADGSIFDTERSSVGGYAASLSLMNKMIWNNDYIRLQYSHNIGHTGYTGGNLFPVQTPYGSVQNVNSIALRDISLRYGSGFVFGNSAMVTPFLEAGQHKWDRGVNQGENYSNGYYGIGVLGQYSPIHSLVLSAEALVGRTKNSRIDIQPLDGVGFGAWSGGLGSSPLYQYGVSADYALTKSFHVDIGADYTEFKYGMSAVHFDLYGNGFLEPDSKTKYTTYTIGVGYAF